MNEEKRHILVTGTHRSGTTWIGRTLAKSEGIRLVYEPFNVDGVRDQFEYRFDHWFEYVPTSPKRDLIEKEFDKYIPSSFLDWPFKVCRESGYSLKTPLIFAKHLLLSYRRPRLLLKDPIALLSAGWLYQRYDLHVICTIRHPLAFVGSLKKQGWDFNFDELLNQTELVERHLSQYREEMENAVKNSTFIERAALLWKVLNHIILEYQATYPEWMFVKHEEIATDPVSHFARIFRFVNIEFSKDVKEYIISYTSSGNPADIRSNDYQPRDAKKVLHTWKKRLSDEEIRLILQITEPVRKKLYPVDPFKIEATVG